MKRALAVAAALILIALAPITFSSVSGHSVAVAQTTVSQAEDLEGFTEEERQRLDQSKQDSENYLPILTAICAGVFFIGGILYLRYLAKHR